MGRCAFFFYCSFILSTNNLNCPQDLAQYYAASFKICYTCWYSVVESAKKLGPDRLVLVVFLSLKLSFGINQGIDQILKCSQLPSSGKCWNSMGLESTIEENGGFIRSCVLCYGRIRTAIWKSHVRVSAGA